MYFRNMPQEYRNLLTISGVEGDRERQPSLPQDKAQYPFVKAGVPRAPWLDQRRAGVDE